MDPLTAMLPTTPAEPPNGSYKFQVMEFTGNKQLLAMYGNGYGASVVQGPYSYGGSAGLYELAVLHGDDPDTAPLCYATEITDDVIGHLTQEEVVALLHRISKLTPNLACRHKHPLSR